MAPFLRVFPRTSRIRPFFLILSLGALLTAFLPTATAADIQNGGFETGSAGTANNWSAFTNGTATSQRRDDGTDSSITDIGAVSGLSTRTGAYAWYANASGANNTGGAFQNLFGPRPGDTVTFSGFIQGVNVNSPATGNIRIEWMNNSATIVRTDASSGVGASSSYTSVTATGVMPGNATFARLTFSTNLNPNGSGDWAFDDLDAAVSFANRAFPTDYSFPVTLSASQSTGTHRGDVVTISTVVTNVTAVTISNLELVVQVPAGFNFLSDSAVRSDGRRLGLRPGTESTLMLGDLASGAGVTVVFQLLVTSGVEPGHTYDIEVFARSGVTLGQISAVVQFPIRMKHDPLFDEGTILGKVFDDRNEDGMQSKGEIGIPHVRIYTEYGVNVITDKNGLFHIPAVPPGRHVLKIDGHTLPKGTIFVTEESLVLKTTPGLLNKVRFAVRLPDSALPKEFQKDLQFWVTQGVDLARPELKVTMEPDLLRLGAGRLEREPTFRIKINYGDFIAGWRLEIEDEQGETVWTGAGIGQPPPQVSWKGVTDTGEMIGSGIYSYRLVVRDGGDREDWTPLQFFRVVNKAKTPEADQETIEIPSTGNFDIFRDGKRSIPLVAKPTLGIYGKTQPNRRVLVNDIPVEVGPTGEFEEEIFVTPGEKQIKASATNPQGETVTVVEKVTVKDSYFFLVALGEEELGVNWMRGNLETVARDDAFHEDFYEKGRLSYYLKAKIRGKFLVKSRYETGDKRSELFTHLDPEDYYPVYGDSSQIDYEGQDTRERLFVLVEMDRSFLKWGSYQTKFTDTELARYNRTLSGLKVYHETLSSTRYGDAKRGFSLFLSKPEYLADHNEFRATGGALYYLRNRHVIQGSEKVRIETRDKIQDIPLDSRDLVTGKDYEIDYRQGRILLRKPLSSVSASETIISNDILDGNPVFLVVDYEFENFRFLENKSGGLRGFTHLGDHIRVGGTAVEEKRVTFDYDLRAVDATFRAGRNTKVTAEFAQAKFQQVRQATSFDGGLSFRSQSLLRSRRPREKAYLIKGESKPFQPLELSGYLQDVEPGFSVDRIKSQEGFRKYGFQARLKLSEYFRLLGRHDSTEVVSQIRPLPLFGVSAAFEKLHSTTLQALFDYEGWKVTGEYLHQFLDVPLQNRFDSFFSQKPFGNAFGLRIGKRVSDWLTPYLKGQVTFSGKQNFQLGPGLEVQVGDKTKIYFEEMVGNVGDATVLGVHTQKDEKTASYATIKVRDAGLGKRRVSTSIGSSHQLNEHSRIYSEREYSTYSGSLPFGIEPTFLGEEMPLPGIRRSDVYGYDTHFWDRWGFGLRFERRHLHADDFRSLSDLAIDNRVRTNSFNTLSTSLGYDSKKLKFDDSLEVRFEPDAPEVQQWVTKNSVEWKVSQDLSFLGRTNFGNSRFVESGNLTGRFTELNVGFAYRPVESDRFNALTRYTYFDERASDAQFVGTDSGTIAVDERFHIFAIEGAYELTRFLQVVEKLAYRLGSFETAVSQRLSAGTFLWAHRFNYHITRKWDFGLEYRMLFQTEVADNLRHGPLVELDREIYDYVRLGIGYNFTDFDDDLRSVHNFKRNGLFVRLTGKV